MQGAFINHDYTQDPIVSSNIKVFIRARPLDKDEHDNPNAPLSIMSKDFIHVDAFDDKKIVIKHPDPNIHKEVAYQFDKIFWTESKQDEIFDTVCKVQVDHVLNGFNCCCFAYGQTGSGKTYSMFGLNGEFRGLIPRAVESIFKSLITKSATAEVAMVCSFLEIYNDQIRDLGKGYLAAIGAETNITKALNEKTSQIYENVANKRGNTHFAPVFKTIPRKSMNNTTKDNLSDDHSHISEMPGLREVFEGYKTMNYDIREDAEGNVFVKDLSMIPVTTLEEVMSIINMGLKLRATHETKMNQTSSRSHTIFSINIIQRDKTTSATYSGTLHCVDLAGSERLKKSESQGIRMKEALHINTSLTSLGKVIMSLDPSNQNGHIPYRDSKLTRILQNSLGGNSYTTLIAAIHPHSKHYDECLSTLQFANRCRSVRNVPRINYVFDNEDKDQKIKRLTEENNRLRGIISQYESQGYGNGINPNDPLGLGAGKKAIGKLKSILQQFGIDIELNETNNTITCNGKTIAMDDFITNNITNQNLSKEELMNLSTYSFADDDSTVYDNQGNVISPGNSDVKQLRRHYKKLRQRVQYLEEENLNYKERISKKKNLLEEKEQSIVSLTNEIVKLKTTLQSKNHLFQKQLEERDAYIKEYMKSIEQKHSETLNDLVKRSQEQLLEQDNQFRKLPLDLKTYSDTYNELLEKKLDYTCKIENEVSKHIASINHNNEHKVNEITRMYQGIVIKREQLIHNLITNHQKQLSEYQSKINHYEEEILILFQFTNLLNEIIDDIEAGKYPIKSTIVNSNSGDSSCTYANSNSNMGVTGHLALRNTLNNTLNNTMNKTVLSQDKASSVLVSNIPTGAIVLPQGLRPFNPLHPTSKQLIHIKELIHNNQQKLVAKQANKTKVYTKTLQVANDKNDPYGSLLEPYLNDILLLEQLKDFLEPSDIQQQYIPLHQTISRSKSATMSSRTQNKILEKPSSTIRKVYNRPMTTSSSLNQNESNLTKSFPFHESSDTKFTNDSSVSQSLPQESMNNNQEDEKESRRIQELTLKLQQTMVANDALQRLVKKSNSLTRKLYS